MGEAELKKEAGVICIHSEIITYGGAATPELTEQCREEIERMWNEPQAMIEHRGDLYRIEFRITASCIPDISELQVLQCTDPRQNFFRIERFVHGNISFVDGLGSNSGYWLLENLYPGSTTAAHEYGHTLGLPHPRDLDIRGLGVPGIMYPRGTLVDGMFQYDPAAQAGKAGGTMHPAHRKVLHEDIRDLKLHRLRFENNRAIVGAFTNIYHPDHSTMNREAFMKPPIAG